MLKNGKVNQRASLKQSFSQGLHTNSFRKQVKREQVKGELDELIPKNVSSASLVESTSCEFATSSCFLCKTDFIDLEMI